ncbi:MAG: hypothetical protein HAW64_04835, partial [Alphaproteobacteria bacterium]|nr:hypothetical protein [Alphaproteobacteria bacterium]
MSNRLNDIIRFYELLDILKSKVGGVRYLKDCDGRMQWAQRGVYFFMEESEKRSDSGNGLRVVRVGTHAVSAGSQTTLWKRLSQHKGVASTGGGNHRGSVFRKLVGTAILSSTNSECETWHIKKTASREIRQAEQPLEKKVSGVMGAMPFLWVAIDDPASRDSLRGFI